LVDFTQTLFYQALTKIDKNRYSGKFYMSDVVSSFKVRAIAIDSLGRVGVEETII